MGPQSVFSYITNNSTKQTTAQTRPNPAVSSFIQLNTIRLLINVAEHSRNKIRPWLCPDLGAAASPRKHRQFPFAFFNFVVQNAICSVVARADHCAFAGSKPNQIKPVILHFIFFQARREHYVIRIQPKQANNDRPDRPESNKCSNPRCHHK